MRKAVCISVLAFSLFGCAIFGAASAQYEIIDTQGIFRFVVVDKSISSDRAALRSIAKNICSGDAICKVLFWDNKNQAATSLPMTDTQASAQVADYSFNENTGNDELLICKSGNCE